MADVELGTLYEANKEAYKQLTPPTDEEIDNQLTSIGAWFSSKYDDTYFMLLCRELYDFTIFRLKNSEYFEAIQEIKEVLQSRGTILEIAYSHDFHFYECWIKTDNDEVFMYAFFPCDDFVIEVGDNNE